MSSFSNFAIAVACCCWCRCCSCCRWRITLMAPQCFHNCCLSVLSKWPLTPVDCRFLQIWCCGHCWCRRLLSFCHATSPTAFDADATNAAKRWFPQPPTVPSLCSTVLALPINCHLFFSICYHWRPCHRCHCHRRRSHRQPQRRSLNLFVAIVDIIGTITYTRDE